MIKRIGNFIIDDDAILTFGKRGFCDIAAGKKEKPSAPQPEKKGE